MSFAGTVQAMITSIKNNARDRKTLYDSKDLYILKSNDGFEELLKKHATPEQLNEIRSKLKRRNRINKIIAILVCLLMFTGSVFIVYRIMF